MHKLLTRLAIACVILAMLGTIILVYSVQASAPGWVANCRVAPVVDYDGELYRVRCGNGEIKSVDGANVVEAIPLRIIPMDATRTPNPTWEPEPYPAPIETQPNPYP